MQTAPSNASGGGPPRMKRTVSAPGIGHHVHMRSWRASDSTTQTRQMRKALPAVLENEMDDFNLLQLPASSPTPTSPASVERTKKAMQATLAMLRRSSSTPTNAKDGTSAGKENQILASRQRKAVEPCREVAVAAAAAAAGNHNPLVVPRTPSKQLRRRTQKAAAAASSIASAPTTTPSTPTPSKLATPNPPSSAPSSAPASTTRPHALSISIPKRIPIPAAPTTANPSPKMTTRIPPPAPPPAYTASPDPEPFRSSRNISANDMVHAYYTILRERDPAHYLLNLNEEEEEIISQSQYAALLKLACQKFKRGDGKDRVALAYAEEMLGPMGSREGSEDGSGGAAW